MTPADRADLEALGAQVCPHTYHGLPCERPRHDQGRHWAAGPRGQGVNWPSEMSDQTVAQAAS